MAEAELVRCPVCGIKTIPDHEELEYEVNFVMSVTQRRIARVNNCI